MRVGSPRYTAGATCPLKAQPAAEGGATYASTPYSIHSWLIGSAGVASELRIVNSSKRRCSGIQTGPLPRRALLGASALANTQTEVRGAGAGSTRGRSHRRQQGHRQRHGVLALMRWPRQGTAASGKSCAVHASSRRQPAVQHSALLAPAGAAPSRPAPPAPPRAAPGSRRRRWQPPALASALNT